MAFEDLDSDVSLNETPPPEEARNRTFLVVAGILGGIMLLTLVCLGAYALFFAPQRSSQRATEIAAINAQNTQIALAAEQTAQVASFTATPTATSVPPTASVTPVLAAPTEVLVSPTQDPRTATVAALLTQAAAARGTVTPTASGLPQTGFAEDVGVPGLVGLSLALIVVIFLARRLRTANR